MDAHLTPAAGRVPRRRGGDARLRRRCPNPPTPADYERVLRPLYGFAYGVAQVAPARRRRSRAPSEARLANALRPRQQRRPRPPRAVAARVRAGFPAGVWALNRLLRADFDADVSADGDLPQRRRRRRPSWRRGSASTAAT